MASVDDVPDLAVGSDDVHMIHVTTNSCMRSFRADQLTHKCTTNTNKACAYPLTVASMMPTVSSSDLGKYFMKLQSRSEKRRTCTTMRKRTTNGMLAPNTSYGPDRRAPQAMPTKPINLRVHNESRSAKQQFGLVENDVLAHYVAAVVATRAFHTTDTG